MLFTFDMLYDAWKATVIQSSEDLNKARFRYYIEPNLTAMVGMLNDGVFQPAKLHIQIVKYPKERIVQVPMIKDKIVQHAICDNYLTDALSKPMVKETSACLKGKGTLYAADILKRQLANYYSNHRTNKFYILKCDISKYFASIPHDKLFLLIDRYVKDKEVKSMVKKYVDLLPVGLGLGLQQSQLLANLYLSPLDHYCKEVLRAKYYGRYMDDFYIISDDIDYLKECFEKIKAYINDIGLTLNPKTAILSDRFDFLGFTYHLSDTGKVIKQIVKSKRVTKLRYLKKMLKSLEHGDITINKYLASYNGWRNHAKHGNCYSLVKKWDSYLCGELRKLGYEVFISKKGQINVKNN